MSKNTIRTQSNQAKTLGNNAFFAVKKEKLLIDHSGINREIKESGINR
jgi:hypothetical protein